MSVCELMTNEHLLASAEIVTDLESTLAIRLGELMEIVKSLPSHDKIDVCVREAYSQFPAEDELEPLADKVFELGEKLRGDNRKEAREIAEAITLKGRQLADGMAYAKDELEKLFQER